MVAGMPEPAAPRAVAAAASSAASTPPWRAFVTMLCTWGMSSSACRRDRLPMGIGLKGVSVRRRDDVSAGLDGALGDDRGDRERARPRIPLDRSRVRRDLAERSEERGRHLPRRRVEVVRREPAGERRHHDRIARGPGEETGEENLARTAPALVGLKGLRGDEQRAPVLGRRGRAGLQLVGRLGVGLGGGRLGAQRGVGPLALHLVVQEMSWPSISAQRSSRPVSVWPARCR